MPALKNGFAKFALTAAMVSGSAGVSGGAFLLVLAWIVWAAGQHFSQTSQMPINTVSAIVTLLLAFLIQYAQNKESRAVQLKLDALLIAVKEARTELVNAESRDDDTLTTLSKEVQAQAAAAL